MGKTGFGLTVFSTPALLLRRPNLGAKMRGSQAKGRNLQSASQAGLVSAMMQPGFYPKAAV
jgi:hypothetical protein